MSSPLTDEEISQARQLAEQAVLDGIRQMRIRDRSEIDHLSANALSTLDLVIQRHPEGSSWRTYLNSNLGIMFDNDAAPDPNLSKINDIAVMTFCSALELDPRPKR